MGCHAAILIETTRGQQTLKHRFKTLSSEQQARGEHFLTSEYIYLYNWCKVIYIQEEEVKTHSAHANKLNTTVNINTQQRYHRRHDWCRKKTHRQVEGQLNEFISAKANQAEFRREQKKRHQNNQNQRQKDSNKETKKQTGAWIFFAATEGRHYW